MLSYRGLGINARTNCTNLWNTQCASNHPVFSILKNKLIGYADDSTLIAVVPSPGVQVTIAESLNGDNVRVNAWCDLWGMKLNESKTKTMMVSRSRTMHPQPPPLTIDGTVLKESDDLDIFGVTFDSKLTFEKHLCTVSRAASQRLGIVRKSWHVFHDRLLIGRCFLCFVLPVLEYSSAVWCSAADTHLKLLVRVVSGACFLAGGVLNCNLSHRRSVAVLCMLYKIRCNLMHPLCGALAVPYVPVRITRGTLIAHRYTYVPPHCRTSRRTFIPSQYLPGMIWLTPYSMVWDWRVSRAGPMRFCWISCSLIFCLQLFSLSLLFLYRLVAWGWGLRTDRVSI